MNDMAQILRDCIMLKAHWNVFLFDLQITLCFKALASEKIYSEAVLGKIQARLVLRAKRGGV